MRRLPPLSSLRAFEAAARHGSFKGAAGELAVTPTAISHQIRALEEHLELRLFERRTRRVVLTEQGRSLFVVLRDGFDSFALALDRLKAQRGRPAVTISATMAFTARWLVPRVARFQAGHPEIDLRLHASDAPVDLQAGQADLAIRYGRGPYPELRAAPLLADRFAPVANPGLGVREPLDLQRVPLIHFDWARPDPANPTWPGWFEAAGLPAPHTAPQLRFSDESHAIQAAVAGQGVALLSLALVQDEIAAGRLCQPFGPLLDGMTYHVVEAAQRLPSRAVETVRAWLLAEARP